VFDFQYSAGANVKVKGPYQQRVIKREPHRIILKPRRSFNGFIMHIVCVCVCVYLRLVKFIGKEMRAVEASAEEDVRTEVYVIIYNSINDNNSGE
jgi:hypothetical protein